MDRTQLMYQQVLEVLSSATDPTVEMSIVDRRKKVASGIAQAIHANVWIWTIGRINEDIAGDAMVTSFIDNGFKDENERAEFYRIIIHPDLAPVVVKPIYEGVRSLTCITRSRRELIVDDQWRLLPTSVMWNSVGFDDFILSLFPLDGEAYSCIGFHRRLGSLRFSSEEVEFVSVVFPAIDWLHATTPLGPTSSCVTELSPRERQVFMLLLKGTSRNDIANQLKLSSHTITDYIKEIYRKLDVSSRPELLLKFLS